MKDEVPQLLLPSIHGTMKGYTKSALILRDVLYGPSRMLRSNPYLNATIVPGRPKGRVLKAFPHIISRKFDNKFPDVYVSYTVPVEELMYCQSYDDLYVMLEDTYGLTRSTNDNGNICYITDDESADLTSLLDSDEG